MRLPNWPGLIVLIGLLASLTEPLIGLDGNITAKAPSKDQIRGWINQLGDDDFEKREEASQKLWEAGEAAEAAIKESLTSKDAEVSRRAKDLYDKFRLGIYPTTPPAVVTLIERYQQSSQDKEGRQNRDLVVHDLVQNGMPGCRALLKIFETAEKKENRDELSSQITENLPGVLPLVTTQADRELFERIIEVGVRNGSSAGIRHGAAYWLSIGRVEEKIRFYQEEENNQRKPKECAEILAYLLRAAGKPDAAVEAARRAQLPSLLNALLIEAGHWKELCEVTESAKKGNAEPVVLDDSRYRLATEAALERLAGNKERFEQTIQELIGLIKEESPEDRNRLTIARLLLVLGKPQKGLEILRPESEDGDTLFELLVAQHKIPEARELVKQIKAKIKPEQQDQLMKLESLEGRVLYSLGEKEQAKTLFRGVAERIKANANLRLLIHLIEPEFRVGMLDEAFEHSAIFLSERGAEMFSSVLFNTLFAGKSDAAERIWQGLRKIMPEASSTVKIQHLRNLMAGKASPADLQGWVDKLTEKTKTLKVGETKDYEPAWLGLGQAAILNQQEEIARTCLMRSNNAEALLLLGDHYATKNNWEKAAQTYYQSWEKDRAQALPLYLSGRALIKLGQTASGKTRQEQAQILPLGDEQLRSAFMDELAKREEIDGLRHAIDLQLRLCQPNSYYHGDALRKSAQLPGVQGNPGKQADLQERSQLRLLSSGVSFRIPAAYLVIPANVIQLRAQAHLAAGKMDEMRSDLALYQEYLPGGVDLVITMHPLLLKAGLKKEADALFEQSLKTHEAILKEYPNCSWAHNSIAWMSACCWRDLENAQLHAEKAVALSKSAGHLDTLAEIFFQRGNRDKAIETQKQAIALAPERTYYKKQLQRIEAGDPKAPLPPEVDAED